MATPKWGTHTMLGSDLASTIDDTFNSAMTDLDDHAKFRSGVFASRPAASTGAGLYYYATDINNGTLYVSDGAAWKEVSLVTNTKPSFRAYFTATATSTVAIGDDTSPVAGGHTIILPSERWDPLNMYDIATGSVIWPTPGYYMVGFQADLKASQTGNVTIWLANNTYSAGLGDYPAVSPIFTISASAKAIFTTIVSSTLFSAGVHLRGRVVGASPAQSLEVDAQAPTETYGTCLWGQWLGGL